MQDLDFILLLSKRFSGEIDAQESAALDAWLGESPENAQLAEQYQTVWNNSTFSATGFNLDMDAEYRRLQMRLGQSEQVRSRQVLISRQILRIAAALAVLLTAVWGYRQFAFSGPALQRAYAQNMEKRRVDLPDGSRVWLRRNASLEFPAQFGNAERRVKLNGEAYFEVSHRENQPFHVEIAQGGTVEVLGTRFHIRPAEDGAELSVLVRDGKVRFSPDGKSSGAVLAAMDKAVFIRETSQLRLSKVSTLNELAWQREGLEFVRTPLRDVLTDLEKYYHVKIALRNSALEQCPYTAPLTNQPINTVLESLSLTYQFQISNPAPGQYILSGGKCQ